MTGTDSLVDAYLDRLESELAGVPRAARREVLEEIEAHLAEARAGLPLDDEAAVRNLLERLGDPAEIAAEVRDRYGVQRSRTTWREVGALILLPVGSLVIPFVGWFIGVVLLWVSDGWSSRDKVIGTLLLPGGLGGALFFLLRADTSSSCLRPTPNSPLVCHGPPVWPLVLFAVLVLAPLATDAYLIWRLRGGARAAV